MTTEAKKIPTFIPAVISKVTEPKKPEEGKPDETGLTPEQVKAAANEMLQTLGFTPPPPEPEKPKTSEELAAEVEAKRVEEERAAQEQAEKDKANQPPARRRQTPPVDTQKIADDAAARAVADADRNRADAEAAELASKAPKLSPEDQRDLAALRWMESKDPNRPKLADQFLQFAPKLAAYRAEWEVKNSDSEFDPNAAEHAKFYADNEPAIDATELDRAHRRMEIEEEAGRIADEKMKPVVESQRRVELKAREREIYSDINAAQVSAITQLLKEADPEILKLVSSEDGKIDLSMAGVKKIEEFDPFAAKLINHAATTINRAVEEIRKFSDPEMSKNGYTFNPNGNHVHNAIASVAMDAEKMILEGPQDVQVRDGKQFVTAADWNKKLKQAGGDKSARSKVVDGFWTFNSNDLEQLFIGTEINMVKQKIAEMNAYSDTREKRRGGSSAQNPPPNPEPAKPIESQVRRPAPSISSSTNVVTPPGSQKNGEKTFGEKAVDTAFS